MKITILTLFPDYFTSPLGQSLLGKAGENNLLSFEVRNIRDYTPYNHGQVDDSPYGGGSGLVMMPEAAALAIESIPSYTQKNAPVIYPTPRGEDFTQADAEKLSSFDELIFLCGRYEGVDERVLQTHVTYQYSLGNCVTLGGEAPTLMMIEAVARLLPGVIGKEASHIFESFSPAYGQKREYPLYTRPQIWRGIEIPPALKSGHHKMIFDWKEDHLLD